MTTIGDLTLAMIGTTRVRTKYEGATIEGLITSIDLDIEVTPIRSLQGREARDRIEVAVDLTLGHIELQRLNRNHPCEVTR